MSIIPPADAHAELSQVTAVGELEAGAAPYPYTRLSADDFERLAYALFTASEPPGQARFWQQASIMVRGADAGRDVVLLADGELVGVVQCKRLETAIDLPTVFRELCKLIIFPLVDTSLPKVGVGLTYFLALGHECARTVLEFFDRPAEMLKLRKADVEAAVREVLETFATLTVLNFDAALDLVNFTLAGLRYCLLRPVLLDAWVSVEPDVATRFFRHRMVVDQARVDAQYASLIEILRRDPDRHQAQLDYRLLDGTNQSLREIEEAIRARAPAHFRPFREYLMRAKSALAIADQASEKAAAARSKWSTTPQAAMVHRFKKGKGPLLFDQDGGLGACFWNSGDEFFGEFTEGRPYGLGIYKIYDHREFEPDSVNFFKGQITSERKLGPIGTYEFSWGRLIAGDWTESRPSKGYMSNPNSDARYTFYFGDFDKGWIANGYGIAIAMPTREITCGEFVTGTAGSNSTIIGF